MSEQPEAHRLADTPFALRDGRWNFQADDELRRLHSVNAQLLEALELAANADLTGADARAKALILDVVVYKARAAIAAAKGEA